MLICILTPDCQSGINLSLWASLPLHFWRNEWQNSIKKKSNRMAACCFFFNDLCIERQSPLRVNSKPLRWTDISWDRWSGKAGELMWQSNYNGHISNINYSFTITYPLLASLQWEDRAASKPWNVSPRWAWHLQIRAHYLGVTCPVPFKYHREGRMCVCVLCCYAVGVYK